MAVPKYILNTGFSFKRMLGMEAGEARRYFVLNYFVPVGLEILSPATAECSVVLFLVDKLEIDGATRARPLFAKTDLPLTGQVWSGGIIPGDQTGVQYFERICGEKLDLNEQDKALKHAFGHLLDASLLYLDYLPAVCSLQNLVQEGAGRNLKLDVVVAKKKDLSWYTHTAMTGVSRSTSLQTAGPTYGHRGFNAKTGEWIGLCEPTDETCCEACKGIYRSRAANNYYDA